MPQAQYSMVAKIGADITDYSAKLRKAWQDTEEFRTKTERSGQAAQDRVRGMMSALSTMQGKIAALTGTASVAMFTALAEQATTLENQMRGIGVATDEAREKIYRLSMETRTSMEATVGLLRSMSKSLRDQPLERTIRQVATLNRLLTIGGLDAGQRGSVALQLGQALQSGVLQGDELRALRESAPHELMEAIARSAGGTIASLRDLGSQGKLTTEVVVRALDNLEQESKDKFGSFQMTIRESGEVLQTALIQVAGRMNEGLGFTDAWAKAQAGLAEIMMSGGDAAENLGRAINDLAQVALVAAGARGLATLGGALAAVNTSAITLMGTLGAMRGAFGGFISLLGGPWGAAFFAAGTAMLVLSERSKSIQEEMDAAAKSIEAAKGSAEAFGEARNAIKADQEQLLVAEQKLKEAIEAQATAAEQVARRDIVAINSRLTANRELLEVKRLLVAEELRSAEQDLSDARRKMVGQARIDLGYQVAEMAASGKDISDEGLVRANLERLHLKSRAGEELLDREKQWLDQFIRIDALEKQLASSRTETLAAMFPSFDAHVQGYAAERERMGAILNGLIDQEEKRNARLKELYAARDEIERQLLQSTSRGERPSNDLLLQSQAVREEITKLTNARGRIEEMSASMTQLQQVVDQIRFVDPDEANRLERILIQTQNELMGIVTAGQEVDNIQLENLEAELAGALTAADKLHQKFLEINATNINPSFDQMRSQLSGVPAQLQNLSYMAIDPTAQREKYTQERIAGTGKRTEELVRSVARAASTLGVDPKDLLALILFESGGDPSKRGGKNNQHIGLIQFGPEEQRTYGANQRQTIDQQMDAVIKYMIARGVKAGDDLTTMYAAVLGGHVSKLNASDLASGGVVRNVTEATRGQQFAPFRARAAGMWEAYSGIGSEEVEEATRLASEAERAAEARQQWLEDMTDSVERSRLEAEIAGKTAYEQQRILFIEQQKSNAKAQGLEWDEEAQRAAEAAADAEIEKLRTIGALEKLQQEEALRHAEALAKAEEKRNERLQFAEQVNEAIVQGTIDTVRNIDNWRDALNSILDLYIEAYLRSAIFGQGPLSQQTANPGGGWGGFAGMLMNIGSSIIGGMMGGGGGSNISAWTPGMAPAAPSMPTPIPTMLSMPQAQMAVPTRDQVDLNISMNTDYLHAEIDTRADRRISSAAPRIQVNAQRSMTQRMRDSKKGWASV